MIRIECPWALRDSATRRYKRVKRRRIHSRVIQFFSANQAGAAVGEGYGLLTGWDQRDKGALDRLMPKSALKAQC